MQNETTEILTQTITYTIEELQKLVLKQPVFYPLIFVGNQPIHLYTGPEIPGEVFRSGKVTVGLNKFVSENVEASNYGRIRLENKEILRQVIKTDEKGMEYLSTYINTECGSVAVHRIVACIWNSHPEKISQLHVHHITNNQYDNRPSNLLWVLKETHGSIHNPKQDK